MKAFLAPLLIILVAGCSILPDKEAPKSLVSAEKTYLAALQVVQGMIDQEVIRPNTESGNRVVSALISARAALDAWHFNPDSSGAVALAALAELKIILKNARPEIGA